LILPNSLCVQSEALSVIEAKDVKMSHLKQYLIAFAFTVFVNVAKGIYLVQLYGMIIFAFENGAFSSF